MKRAFIALVTLVAAASAACRQYDVDVYRNFNDTVYGPDGVTQSFTCTSDSLLWAEFFVGAANSGGEYYFEVLKGTQLCYDGRVAAAPESAYRYVRAELSPTGPPLIKGKEYVLKVTHSNPGHNENLNWYADTTNPYQYGMMSVPGNTQPLYWDLCARIEGVNRAVSREFFGVNENLEGYKNNGWPWLAVVPVFDSAGAGWWRCCRGLWIQESLRAPVDSWDWSFSDIAIESLARHGIRTLFCFDGCAYWACTDTSIPESTLWWVWRSTPPRNLAEPVLSGDSVNPDNYWAYFVYRVVMRYKPGGTFWTGNRAELGDSFGIRCWEIGNEPNYMTSPQAGFGYPVDSSFEDSVSIVESLYARICDVSLQAAQIADPEAEVFVGALGGVEVEDPHPIPPATYRRLVKGKDWLRGYYHYRQRTDDFGVSVHPYQESSGLALNPAIFARDNDTIRSIMRGNSDGDKPLWATELSWLGGPPGLSALSVPAGNVMALAGDPVNFYDRVFWASGGYNSGFLWPDTSNPGQVVWTRKACYYAYRQMTQELLGKRMNGRVLSGNPVTDSVSRVYELEDTATHKKTWVGWRNYAANAETVSVKVPVRTNLIDTAKLDLQQRSGGSTSFAPSLDGWFSVSLDTIPVYVHEPANQDALRPDLVVDSLWISVVPGSSVWPQMRRLCARISNTSNTPSSAITQDAQTPAPVKFYANGVQVAQVAHLPVIYHGQPLKVYSDGPWQIDSSGNYLVKAVVNENRSFVELNWDNNTSFRLFRILPILGSQGGVNGPRTMARATGSSPIQAVAEFTQSGNPLVFYCPSLDSATSGWDSLTTGRHPALGLGPDGLPYATFTRGDSVIGMVYNGSVWRTKVIFAPASGQHVGPAALTVFQSRGKWKGTSAALGQVVFPVYQSGSPNSFVLHARFDTLNVYYDTLDKAAVTNDRDSAVSLCSGITDTLHVAYQKNLYTYYRTARYDTTATGTGFWSSAKQFGSGVVSAVRPHLEQFKDRVWLVFRRKSNSNIAIMRVSHDVATAYSNWTGGSPVSNDNLVPKDFPVLSTNEVAAWAEGTAGSWHIRARVRDSIADLSDSIANHPHILADTSITDGPSRDRLKVRGLWASRAAGDTWFEACSDRNFDRSAAAANATESNNGRKLVKQTDSSGTTLHMVYHTQAGAVYYAEAPAGTSQWTRTDLDGGDLPCIDLDYTNKRLWVAYRSDSSPGVKCQTRSTDSTTWQELTVYDCGSPTDSTEPGAPAIIGARSDPGGKGKTAAYCVFALQNHQVDSSFVVLVKLNQNGVQDTDTLDRAALAEDSLPAISARAGDYLSVVWQKGTEIHYRASTDSVRPDTNRPITWSNAHNLSNTQGLSRHAAIEVADSVLVVWCEGDTGSIQAKGQAVGSAYNTWGDAVALSSDSNPCDYPTVAVDDDSVVVAWQVQTGTNTRIINARVNFGTTLTIVARNDPVAFPHIAFETAKQDSDTVCYIDCAYSEEPRADYYEACCDRYDLSGGGGGGGQSAGVFDPAIRPMLYAPAPNPFNGLTCIRYQTNVKGLTRVCIMDITGRRVRNLLTMPQKPGVYTLTWNARDDRERQLPRGVYFVRLQTENYHESRKLILTE